MYALTAAHRDLPFGSRVMVRNLANNRVLAVRINDRGPFVESRIIDLSYAAARRLGVTTGGSELVKIWVVHR
jgi:rare lipoprotein A